MPCHAVQGRVMLCTCAHARTRSEVLMFGGGTVSGFVTRYVARQRYVQSCFPFQCAVCEGENTPDDKPSPQPRFIPSCLVVF